ncbi:MAG: aspartyl protease family protein [Bacteroidetes bacterium]|nr:aspartyl protease family protein [Bacteroidota bacterium]MCL1968885.1 aspartyl protease family protein [Bacteroidota bacterium]MCL1969000.1 aspartyl protease family protein [Bacteroidota bacterium]
MKKLFALFLLPFCVGSILAQNINYNQGSIKQKHYFQEIPYQKIAGVPVVPVTINGKMYKFVFDTGSSSLVISDNLRKELNLSIIGQEIVSGASGEQKKMKKILFPEIHLQEITFTNISGAVFNEDVNFFECLGIDGLIGGNMLRNSIVHFDEQSQHIIITDNIKKLSLRKVMPQKMELSSTQCLPFITIFIQNGEKREGHKVLFDSGQDDFYMMSIRNNNGLNINTNIVKKISESEGSFGFGIHGSFANQEHLLLSIPEIIVNKIPFNDVIITTTHDGNSRIGAKLLQYGKTTLDYKKKRFYFEPFDNINTSELSKMPLAINFTFKNDKMVVGIIWDKALESQINLGDEVLSINGVDIQSMNFCELVQLRTLPDGDGSVIELKDIKTGETKKVEIKRLQFSR